MKNVGIKFILKGAAFITAIVPEVMGQSIISSWLNNTMKPKIGDHSPTTGWPWAVETDQIQGMHVFPLEPNTVVNPDQIPAKY